MAMNVLGEQFVRIVNVTLAYPKNTGRPFHDMPSGWLTRVQVWIGRDPGDRSAAWRLHQRQTI